MIKKTLIVLMFLCFSSVYAQYEEWTPAEIILNNGNSFRGIVKFPMHSGGLISIGTTEFKYKKNRKSPTKKYGSDTVREVIFGDKEFSTIHYKYVPIKKNKFVLMVLIVSGKVNLYSRTVLKSNSFYTGNPTIPYSTTYYENAQFYLIRNNEEKAKLITDTNSLVGFIAKTKAYFSDCEKIVYYLDNQLYNFNNLIELVEDYNLLCE